MKHPLIALAICSVSFLCSTSLSAQSKHKQPGKITFSTGIGVLPNFVGDAATSSLPPVNVRAGYQFSDRFALNGFLGYSAATSRPRSFSDGFQTHVVNKSLMLGARGEIHHKFNTKLDFYGGAMFGVNVVNLKEINTGTGEEMVRVEGEPTPYNPKFNNKQLLYAAFVGANLFIVKGVGFFGEVGYGVSLLNLGLTFKL